MKKRQAARDPNRGGRVIDDGPIAPLVKAIGTLPKLAELTGLSVTTLRRINQGERAPHVSERMLFAVLARTYNVKPPFPTKAPKELRRRDEQKGLRP